jgi:hypothetical protein
VSNTTLAPTFAGISVTHYVQFVRRLEAVCPTD